MDNHVGDWLYYIVILAVAAISWLNSANKKKRREQSQTPAPSSSWPEEEFLPPPPPPAPRQTKRQTPPAVPSQRRAEFRHRLFTPAEEGGRAIASQILYEEEPGTPLVETLELTDPDTFRKAVVYAEIMNRKYE
ncbi:MAG: hypothetical protein LBT76_02055 [Tannerella sp.]|nr:hypothetical protein [Tannerella sp.]